MAKLDLNNGVNWSLREETKITVLIICAGVRRSVIIKRC